MISETHVKYIKIFHFYILVENLVNITIYLYNSYVINSSNQTLKIDAKLDENQWFLS